MFFKMREVKRWSRLSRELGTSPSSIKKTSLDRP